MSPTSNEVAMSQASSKVESAGSADQPIDQPIIGAIATPKTFILAGKAIFTLVGVSSRYTYKVTRKDGDDRYPETYFVSLLTGPENTSDYTYLGILNQTSGEVRLTRRSAYTDQSAPVVAIRWALGRIWADRPLPEPATILHAGRCGRCSRLLTVPESIASGFGPECLGRL